jgi:hypothetical protein
VSATCEQQKHIILVREPDPGHGGQSLAANQEQCPKQYRESIFAGAPITWQRIHDFQIESLRQIASKMLLNSPAYLKEPADDELGRVSQAEHHDDTFLRVSRELRLQVDPASGGRQIA